MAVKNRSWTIAGATGLLVLSSLVKPSAAPRQAPARPTGGSTDVRATLDRYCVRCHNARLKSGGLALDAIDAANLPAHADVWEKVIRKVRTGVMPPLAVPRPDDATRAALVATLTRAIDGAASRDPYPGHPSIHRLNRAEYANAVRDLLAVDIDPASYLPPDDQLYGFDNIGEGLALSPALLERYASAAEAIATLAVGDAADVVPTARVFRAPVDLSQDQHNDGLPLGTVGGFLVKTTLPLDGAYTIRANLFKTNLGLIRGLEFPRTLQFIVDGNVVFEMTIGGEAQFADMLQNQTNFADALEAKLQVRVALTAGPHDIGAAFVARSAVENTRRLRAMIRTTSDTSETLLGPPHVMILTVAGPFNPSGPGDTPSRRHIFSCTPQKSSQEEACARQIVATLAHQAFRGTETPTDVRELMAFYRRARAGGTFERGVALALQRILTDPKFLVRIEREPTVPPGTVYRITDLELASRLSFFLWSSIPDDELLRVAADGRLHERGELAQQVRRMLADPKAQALVTNFADQWLQLRNLRSAAPDSREFPDFDDQLREGFRRETEMLFASIMTEDRSVLDLLTADYTFVNERLAKHYGMPNIYGDQFRRVSVADPARRGLLGQGSILTITSHADRTSPVVRGKWVLENLLGTPAPLPPPNVPPLKDKTDALTPTTMRQRMEQHRANPACASCHRMMDPIGFALENFDAVGAWRTRDGRAPIDTTGVFVDGSPIDGPVALRNAVLRHPENFVTTFTEKLLMYALGRGLEYRDMPTVRAIVAGAAPGYRFTDLVQGMVGTAAFQKRIRVADQTSVAARGQ